MEIGLSLMLLGILIWGVLATAEKLGWINIKPKPITSRRNLTDQLKYPVNALEQGKRDMLLPIVSFLYKNRPETMLDMLISVEGENVLRKIAEMICEDGMEWRMRKYEAISLKDGRTSRKYLASPNSDDFAKYILGGQQLIDELDRHIARIYDEKKLEKARLEGLADADRRFDLSRKELKKLQNPQVQAKSEHQDFDKQFKELEENG